MIILLVGQYIDPGWPIVSSDMMACIDFRYARLRMTYIFKVTCLIYEIYNIKDLYLRIDPM